MSLGGKIYLARFRHLFGAEATGAWKARPRRSARLRRHRWVSVLLASIALVALLVCSWGVVSIAQVLDARSAANDAKARLTTIETTLRGGNYLNAATLTSVQGQLAALDADVRRIQGDIPLQPVVTATSIGSSAAHALRMASDFVHAGQAAVDAAQVLIPHLKGALGSLAAASPTATPEATQAPTQTHSGAAASGVPALEPLTLADVQRASTDLDTAEAALLQALAERALVHDGDLRSLGLGSLVATLHKLDAYTPVLPTYLSEAHSVMAALPALLGITKPANYLLFNQDSDELRPTGGFMGNYAVLTLSGGQLTSGVHLHDIYELDCPNGYCPRNLIPPAFAWMTADPTQYALRDSNLDPNVPTSARFAEQLFQHEGGPAVDGVIYMTPALIEDVLRITGPVSVPGFNTTVTADNLRQLIHYFHLAYGTGIGPSVNTSQLETSGRKAFDAVLGSTLLHQVATLPQEKQAAIAHAVLGALTTHDLILYFNDANMEQLLGTHGMDGSVQSPTGDSLLVVDTNIGANYANADVQERITDTVRLDTRGTATHDVTITYSYPVVKHFYDRAYAAAQGYWTYSDFVRVMVPQSAHLVSQTGCRPTTTLEAGQSVWSCAIFLARPETLTLHFKWTVPFVAQPQASGQRYTLLIQRQPGAHATIDVHIVPPTASRVTLPLQLPLVLGSDGTPYVAAGLTQDERLIVTYTP